MPVKRISCLLMENGFLSVGVARLAVIHGGAIPPFTELRFHFGLIQPSPIAAKRDRAAAVRPAVAAPVAAPSSTLRIDAPDSRRITCDGVAFAN
jgi:hypothetical protein